MAGAGEAAPDGAGEGRRNVVRDESFVIVRGARSVGVKLSEREPAAGAGEEGRLEGRKMDDGRRACIMVCND